MRIKIPWVLMGLALLAVGCADPPTARVEAVKQGLDALSAGAEIYAPDAYATAQNAVAQLDAELATQEGTFVLMRSYERATELASAVEAATGRVRQAIDGGTAAAANGGGRARRRCGARGGGGPTGNRGPSRPGAGGGPGGGVGNGAR